MPSSSEPAQRKSLGDDSLPATPAPGVGDPGRSSTWVLIGVNLIPLFGVILGGWTLLGVVAIYWFENVLIGIINVLRMATCRPEREHFRDLIVNIVNRAGQSITPEDFERKAAEMGRPGAIVSAPQHERAKWFLIPFFVFHYGLFCLVHGIFIFSLLGDGFPGTGGPIQLFGSMIRETMSHGGWIAALAIGASHGYSFVVHFLRGGEFRQTNVMLQMVRPYGRIVVLHIAVLFGAIAIMFLGQPMFLLLLLVLGKTMLDRAIHDRSHRGAGR